jgi:4-amino-4-deoxy-L-arabinose transferase-like glycosyltransferase
MTASPLTAPAGSDPFESGPFGSDPFGPEPAAPDLFAPESAASEPLDPDPLGPYPFGPEPAGSESAGSEWAGSESAGPDTGSGASAAGIAVAAPTVVHTVDPESYVGPSPWQRFSAHPVGRWLVGRLPLLAVLALQAVLALRLHNTAFEDEALYLYAGHHEIAWLLHHSSTFDNYSTYFSGAPFLYPVLGAAADGVFGLEGARLLSLLFMLGATCCVWGVTRRLYGRPAAACAAALFAVAAPTLFLSRLATYDPMSLFLLSLSLWIVVATARRMAPLVLLAVPPAVLAVGTKYAGLLFVPTIVLVAVFAGRYGGRTRGTGEARLRGWIAAIGRGLLFALAFAGLVYAWLKLLGPSYVAGITSTTTNRASGGDSLSYILKLAAELGAGVALLALIGIWVDARLAKDNGANRGEVLTRVLLSLALAGTALLAPAYQVHLHTATSLQKHVGFGLLFASPVAGVALAALLHVGARDPRRLFAGLIISLALTWAAMAQSSQLYDGWPDSGQMVADLKTQVRPVTDRILAEEDEVPRYYLSDLTEPYQWYSTFSFTYTTKKGQVLTGVQAYQQAISDQYFALVVLRFGPTAGLDNEIDGPLMAQKGYKLIAKVPDSDQYGTGYYYIWRSDNS